jgi:hypothetical protein
MIETVNGVSLHCKKDIIMTEDKDEVDESLVILQNQLFYFCCPFVSRS